MSMSREMSPELPSELLLVSELGLSESEESLAPRSPKSKVTMSMLFLLVAAPLPWPEHWTSSTLSLVWIMEQ